MKIYETIRPPTGGGVLGTKPLVIVEIEIPLTEAVSSFGAGLPYAEAVFECRTRLAKDLRDAADQLLKGEAAKR